MMHTMSNDSADRRVVKRTVVQRDQKNEKEQQRRQHSSNIRSITPTYLQHRSVFSPTRNSGSGSGSGGGQHGHGHGTTSTKSTKKMLSSSPAKVYDDSSECTGENEKEEAMKDLEHTHTYPAQSLSGDDDDENCSLAAPGEIDSKERDREKVVVEEENEDPKNKSESFWYDDYGTPIGGWRTRLCGCGEVVTQATCWMGCCCTPILVAQLITRFRLTWHGRKGSPAETSLSYNRLVLGLVCTLVLTLAVSCWVPFIYGGLWCLVLYYVVVVVYVGSQVRGYVRHKYKIPFTCLPTWCGHRVDDVCLMLCCGCCSSIQMARHTHDDKEYPGHGCTTTGLEYDAPTIV